MQDYRNLTNEELAAEYQATQDEGALQMLIEKNKGLLWSWVKEYRIPHYEAADLISEAYEATWQAARSFEPERGYCFTSHLKGCVKQRLNRLYNAETRHKRYNGSSEVSYEELAEIDRERGAYDRYGIELADFLNTLSGKAKEVARLFAQGFSNGEVSRALDIKPSSVNYHMNRIKAAYVAYAEV